MTSTNKWERLVAFIRKCYFRLTDPSPEILEEELRLKIRFFNSTVFFFLIVANFQFLFRIMLFFFFSEPLLEWEFIQSPFFSVVALTFLYLGRTEYYKFAHAAIFLVPLIQPLTAISLYHENPNADLITFNPMMIFSLGILLAGIIYSIRETTIFFLVSSLELVFFYGFVFKYPVEWITPKIIFLSIIGFITIIGILYRGQLDILKDQFKGQRDRFVFMTNHELRNPCTVIKGYNEWLLTNYDRITDQQKISILSNISNNVARLERLIEEVSDVDQIERGIFQIKKEEFDFNQFFVEFLSPYQSRLTDVIDFHNLLNDEIHIMLGDQDRLSQVFINILENALKQTPQKTRKISIIVDSVEDYLRVSIGDNGAGIASENLEIIFNQFVSLQTEFSSTGTGIGLYVARQIVNNLGGEIRAESEGVGLGSTIIVRLPIHDT
ncbi:MAG: sensor histidine kinase [Candidatus Hodarchaeales archaeon]|jgi:signal transduction histidine kinase